MPPSLISSPGRWSSPLPTVNFALRLNGLTTTDLRSTSVGLPVVERSIVLDNMMTVRRTMSGLKIKRVFALERDAPAPDAGTLS
jgi:hypothetical protein